MERIDSAWVSEYMKDDIVGTRLPPARRRDEALGCKRWLQDSAPKRAIYWKLYGDLFGRSGLRVLDVGGGMTSFTSFLLGGTIIPWSN